LLDEKIGHIRARDEAVTPLRRFSQYFVAVGCRAGYENARPDNYPIELAIFDQALLNVLVVIGAAEKNRNGTR
jgi:hypothetical protein